MLEQQAEQQGISLREGLPFFDVRPTGRTQRAGTPARGGTPATPTGRAQARVRFDERASQQGTSRASQTASGSGTAEPQTPVRQATMHAQQQTPETPTPSSGSRSQLRPAIHLDPPTAQRQEQPHRIDQYRMVVENLPRTLQDRRRYATALEEFCETFLPLWQDNYRAIRSSNDDGASSINCLFSDRIRRILISAVQ